MRSLLDLASKASSGTIPLLLRGPSCWQMGDGMPFVRALASVAASTPFDIGKHLSINALSPLSVQVTHRSTGDMSVELSGADVSERFRLEAGTTESVSTKQPAELVATIPERYCGVSVKSQGGNITLPGLTETYLDIRTDGDGDVNVGKIKANSVAITTQRGSITGSITATDASGPYELVIDESKDNKTLLYAEIKIEASNGDITLKRVAGKTAHLATGGGRLAMDALQVAAGKVHSGGGSITIGQVTPYAGDLPEEEGSAAQAVQVHSGGGNISIRGLDGSLSIDSAGGDVVLQCTRNMRQATVRSQGGNVTVFAQPGMQIQLHAAGGKGVEIQEGCTVTGPYSQQAPTMVQGCLEVQESSPAGQGMSVVEALNAIDGGASEKERNVKGSTRGERAEPSVESAPSPAAEKPLLVVHAGDGGVSVQVRSWRDSMLQRLSKKRATA